MPDMPKPPAKRPRRPGTGARAAPKAEILPPEAILADTPPPVAADMDDSLPPDLEFEPVPRRARSNGLTPKRQRLFIKYLALTGSVQAACRAIGCSDHAIYHLRNSPGADSFAQAWERAVERGARRVRDVLVEQAIEGIPERIYKDGELVAERRVFNTRAQMWIAAHYMPDKFGVSGGLMHVASSPIALKRLKEEWRKEWYAEQEAKNRAKSARTTLSLNTRFNAIRSHFKRSIAHDPALRAAWELLTGPTDWSDFDKVPAYKGYEDTPINQNRPDMIVTMAIPLGENGEAAAEVLVGMGDVV